MDSPDTDKPHDSGEVGPAARSCLILIVVLAAVLLLICVVGLARTF